MTLLHVAELLVFVLLSLGAGEIGGGHGESVGEQVGDAEDDHHGRGKAGADNARHDGEGGDRAVDAAIDPVPQIADVRAVAQALGDRAGGMAVFETRTQKSVPFPDLKGYLAWSAWLGNSRKPPSHSHFNRLYSGDFCRRV